MLAQPFGAGDDFDQLVGVPSTPGTPVRLQQISDRRAGLVKGVGLPLEVRQQCDVRRIGNEAAGRAVHPAGQSFGFERREHALNFQRHQTGLLRNVVSRRGGHRHQSPVNGFLSRGETRCLQHRVPFRPC